MLLNPVKGQDLVLYTLTACQCCFGCQEAQCSEPIVCSDQYYVSTGG